jgi:hypothetical protein
MMKKVKHHLSVSQILKKANLEVGGKVKWNNSVRESKRGIYIVSTQKKANKTTGKLRIEFTKRLSEKFKKELKKKWLPGSPIIYIGQTTKKSLSKRIKQFYKHNYGEESPHSGGQTILLLKCPMWVFWAVTKNPKKAEKKLIRLFKEQTNGHRPFANKQD